MRKLVFVTVMAFGLIGAQAAARAQDEEPAADPAADPTAEPAGDGTEGGGETAGGEAGGEAGGGMEEGGGGDMAEAPAKQLRFGVAAVVGVPVAGEAAPGIDWSDLVGIGIGAVGGAMYMLNPKLALNGRLGYIYHMPKDVGGVDISFSEIPILVGASYMVTPMIGLGVDTGINMLKASEGDTDTKTRIPLHVGGDFFLSQNMAAGAGLWISNLLLRDSDVEEGMLMQLEAHFAYIS